MEEQLVRRAGLCHHAALQKNDLIGHIVGELQLVRHNDHRHAPLGEAADDAQHLARQLRVQRARRLVKAQHVRLQGQRPCDGHALLLPAGELAGIAVLLGQQADLPEQAGALTLVKQYNYGKIKVSRYERGEEV